mmetsp:Transcript_5272/g.21570  ORF Transcript_5272/g.21570 Transcript_5272/m.21570 type:complete len:247 (-) Transcript_5272:99-839(-)
MGVTLAAWHSGQVIFRSLSCRCLYSSFQSATGSFLADDGMEPSSSTSSPAADPGPSPPLPSNPSPPWKMRGRGARRFDNLAAATRHAAGSPHLATNCALHTAFDRATSLMSRETRARRHTSGSATRDRSISQTREGNDGVSSCPSSPCSTSSSSLSVVPRPASSRAEGLGAKSTEPPASSTVSRKYPFTDQCSFPRALLRCVTILPTLAKGPQRLRIALSSPSSFSRGVSRSFLWARASAAGPQSS